MSWKHPIVFALVLWVSAGPESYADVVKDPPPVVKIAPAQGEIAKGFAVSPDGAHLAYVQLATARSRSGTLRIVGLPSGAEESSVDGVAVPSRLMWGSGTHVIVIGTAGRQVRVWSVPIAGPLPTTSVGPVDRAEVVDVQGAPTVVTYKRVKTSTITHEVATYAPADLKSLQTVSLVESNGRVDHPDGKIQPIWWSDGSTVLVGRRPGAYDKDKDIRLPHQLVRFNVLSKASTVEAIPVVGFARVTAEHEARPGEAAFVYNRRGIQLVSQAATRTVKLSRPAADYYAGSLHYQPIPNDRLLVSATSRSKRNDPDHVELYVVGVASGDPDPRLLVWGKQRFVQWHAAGSRIAVLRLRDGAPAGPSIDIHELDLGR